jgi:hypothetical protein
MQVMNRFRARIAGALPYLAWASFLFALTGGALLPGTPVGVDIADFIQSVTWTWLPYVVFSVAIVGTVIDIGRDLIPDRIAVYSAALAPTFAGAIDGKLAEKVEALGRWAAGGIGDPLREWTGLMEPAHVSIAALALAWVIARRVVKDGKSVRAGHSQGSGH